MTRLLLPLIALLLSPALWAATLCPHPLRVGYDQWPPYHSRDDGGRMRGFTIEVLEAVMAQIPCQLTYVERPWKRVLQGVKLGEIDIAMEAFINEERAVYGIFSDAYNPGETGLWLIKDIGTQGQGNSLASWLGQGQRLGVTRGYFYGDELITLLARHSHQVSAVPRESQNYHKLLLGRIDGFLGDRLATHQGLIDAGLGQKVVMAEQPVARLPTFFMFSKRSVSPALVTQVNLALAQLRQSGQYGRIWQRYTQTP
ncbi:MAG: transporter substrate-binding domain-containing protein [Aeromonas molluscorum]|uniref:substrate-binding periplasmic protein n=1 Tax=Aeromonas molluscorum TaxID=271417 RepID=UPI003CAB8251